MAELNMPPAQCSPKHILNVLNDKCIQAIFNQLLSNLEDFSSAAQVCKRFQENAKVFYSESGDKRITIINEQPSSPFPGIISYNRAHSFLRIFGQFLQFICLEYISDQENISKENYTIDPKPIDDVVNSIADYCGSTLIEFWNYTGHIDFNTRSQFTALEWLSIASSGLLNSLSSFPELKVLEVRYCKIKQPDLFSKTFPKLEKATFCSIDGLTDDAFIGFQTHNPQLQELHLLCLYPNANITSAILQGIGNRITNLTYFGLICNKDESLMSNLTQDIVHLGGLKKLKNLRFACRSASFSAKSLIDAFAENNVCIESLEIGGASPDFVESLPKRQTLQRLHLLKIPEDMVIECVKNLHGLQELFMQGKVTLHGIGEIVKYGQSLKKLYITTRKIKIDRESYDKLLAITKDKCSVSITSYGGSTYVQPDVRRANFEWLHFMIYSKS